jgi:hypothetical protein
MLPVVAYAYGAYLRAVTLVLATTVSAAALSPSSVAQVEDIKGVVAAQVRIQGHPCDKPLSAERDRAASEPHETVWILRCDNGVYRVKLIPDMAAEINKLD